MHDYFSHPEIVRLALVVGVVVSMMFYERLQLTTGGAIVPAYLSLFIPAPLYIASTLVFGYVTYLLVSVVLARRFILYGRRKFEIEVLCGLAMVMLGAVTARLLGGVDPRFLGLSGIGFLVPGILAHDMFRQRATRTVLAVLATTCIVGLVVFVVSSLTAIAPLRPPVRPPAEDIATGYPLSLLLLGVAASVVVGMLVFSRLNLRSGGFISGAYLALVVPRPLNLVFVLVVALATWFVVTRLLMPRLLIFGRRKLATMVLVAAILGWGAELLVMATTSYVPWRGLTVVTLMVPALIANDAQRHGVERVAWGAALTACGVYGAMNVLAGAVGLLGLR